jgi:hypothetical protein
VARSTPVSPSSALKKRYPPLTTRFAGLDEKGGVESMVKEGLAVFSAL